MVIITISGEKKNITPKQYLYFLAIKTNPGVKFGDFRQDFKEYIIHQTEIYKYIEVLWQTGIIEIVGENKELYVSKKISPKEGRLFLKKKNPSEETQLEAKQRTLFEV